MPALVAVMTGLFAVLGVVYGKRLERDHWRRNERLRAYGDFAAQGDAALFAAFASMRSGKDLTDADAQETLEAGARSIMAAQARIQLLGPQEVADLADGMVYHVIGAWEAAVAADSDVLDQCADTWEASREEFLREAKRALKT